MLSAASRLEVALGETLRGVSVTRLWIFYGWTNFGGPPMLVHLGLDLETLKTK